jgi:twitching motility protein PilT
MGEEIEITDILELAIQKEASDIHFKVGYEPILRCGGKFEFVDMDKFTGNHMNKVFKSLVLSESKQAEFSEKDIDTSFQFKGRDEKKHRYRINAAHDMNGPFIAIRAIPDEIISIEKTGFPYESVWQDITELKKGLVLITGITGSGKTTTLASLIQKINQTRAEHIITIEDPIEYIHPPIKSIISQRELETSVNSFEEGIRSALREDPDVILLPEIRDRTTAYHALEATRTGHLVLATIHTGSAEDTVSRYVNLFDKQEHENVRDSLSRNLAYTLSQQLIPYQKHSGKTLVMEIMNVKDDDGIKNIIRESKDHQILGTLQRQHKLGMITMDQHLVHLTKNGAFSADEAVLYAHRKDDFLNYLKN